ncbi:MAG TPA: sugar transferase [Chloroflexota bacterium]|nr:sugar transferase [Chloroflexota bacterium]
MSDESQPLLGRAAPLAEGSSGWRTRPSLKVPLRLEERRLLLVAADLLVIILAALGSLYVWSVQRRSPFDLDFITEQYRWFFVFAALWIVASAVTNFYDIRLAADLGSLWASIFRASAVALVGYLVIYWLTPPGSLPRNIAGYQAMFTFLGIATSRTAYRLLIGRSPFSRRVIVVGAGGAGQAIVETIHRYVRPHYDVVGFVDEDVTKRLPPGAPRILGTPDDLLDLARKYKAMEIVLAVTYRLRERTFRAVLDCQECGLQVTPMPVLYEEITGRVPVEHVGDNWYVALPLRPASSGGLFPIAKRAFDLVVALLGLALLGVLFLFLGPAIKLSSPGSVFFSQERVGRGGRVFRMHKLRSMFSDAEGDAPVWAADRDPRVTWIGRWMRRMHVDELPQMWSILRGEMSVVGPRPERPQFVDALEREIPFYRLRHAVKPGITGWAQISSGYVDSPDSARLRLEYDLYYIKRQSVWLDVLIVARTLGHVLQFRGR